jgi:peptide/nickel transport system substrate-binding protein
MRYHRKGLSVLLLGMLIALTACGTKPATPALPTAPAAAPKGLVVDLPGEPATLDPGLQYDSTTYGVYRNIYDTFLARDPKSGEITERLAKSWKNISPTEWEFTLQSNIKFHNGDPFTADDVKFSIDRILAPELKSPQFQNFSSIKEVKAVDAGTVRVITKDPYPVLLAQLVNLSIVPAKYTKEKGSAGLSAAPVGTGAYKFEEWTRGQNVTLKANQEYWRGKPHYPSVKFRSVPEPSTRVSDLLAGTADLITTINTDSIIQVEGNANVKVLSVGTERVAYLGFNPMGLGPTAKKEVRQAIAYAINPKEMVDALLGGKASLVTGLLTSLHVGYDATLPSTTYDPAKAKALLAAAGYGSGVEVIFLTSPAYDQRIVQAIQGQLSKVGITVKIQSTDQPTFLKKIQGPVKDWGDIRFGSWSCSCLDADGVIYPLFRTGSIWSSYTSPAFDTAVDQARTTLDPAKRKEYYSQAGKILKEDVPGLGLWQVQALYGARKDLQWTPTVDEQLQIFDMK